MSVLCVFQYFYKITWVYLQTYVQKILPTVFISSPFFCFPPICSKYIWKSLKSQSKTVELPLFLYYIFPPDGALLPLRIVPLGSSQDVQTSCLCFLTDASTILQSLFMQNLKRRNRTTTKNRFTANYICIITFQNKDNRQLLGLEKKLFFPILFPIKNIGQVYCDF